MSVTIATQKKSAKSIDILKKFSGQLIKTVKHAQVYLEELNNHANNTNIEIPFAFFLKALAQDTTSKIQVKYKFENLSVINAHNQLLETLANQLLIKFNPDNLQGFLKILQLPLNTHKNNNQPWLQMLLQDGQFSKFDDWMIKLTELSKQPAAANTILTVISTGEPSLFNSILLQNSNLFTTSFNQLLNSLLTNPNFDSSKLIALYSDLLIQNLQQMGQSKKVTAGQSAVINNLSHMAKSTHLMARLDEIHFTHIIQNMLQMVKSHSSLAAQDKLLNASKPLLILLQQQLGIKFEEWLNKATSKQDRFLLKFDLSEEKTQKSTTSEFLKDAFVQEQTELSTRVQNATQQLYQLVTSTTNLGNINEQQLHNYQATFNALSNHPHTARLSGEDTDALQEQSVILGLIKASKEYSGLMREYGSKLLDPTAINLLNQANAIRKNIDEIVNDKDNGLTEDINQSLVTATQNTYSEVKNSITAAFAALVTDYTSSMLRFAANLLSPTALEHLNQASRAIENINVLLHSSPLPTDIREMLQALLKSNTSIIQDALGTKLSEVHSLRYALEKDLDNVVDTDISDQDANRILAGFKQLQGVINVMHHPSVTPHLTNTQAGLHAVMQTVKAEVAILSQTMAINTEDFLHTLFSSTLSPQIKTGHILSALRDNVLRNNHTTLLVQNAALLDHKLIALAANTLHATNISKETLSIYAALRVAGAHHDFGHHDFATLGKHTPDTVINPHVTEATQTDDRPLTHVTLTA